MTRDIGDYRVRELIGYGGSCEVWRGEHRRTGESVALKRLRDVPDRGRLEREAARLAGLEHPHLARLRELTFDRQGPVLVLDHYPGGSLADLLARRRRLTPGEVVAVLAPVAAAVAYAHDEGLTHGDITPANILFTAAGRPVLGDLGVARVPREDLEVQATPEYVDPLVAAGAVPAAPSDVFGLGAVAFHALTGIPPWNAAGPEATLAVAEAGVLPDLHRLAPGLPPDLVVTVLRALSLDAAERGSAAAFALDLRHACAPDAVAFDVDARGVPARGRTGPVTVGARRCPEPPEPEPAPETGPRRPWGEAVWAPGLLVGGRRALGGVVVGAVLVAAVLLGLRWGSTGDPDPAAAGVPGDATAPVAVSVDAADEFAVPGTTADWAGLVGLLYERRAAAFDDLDPGRLDGVFTAGSAQGAADRAEIQRLRSTGASVHGFDPEVVQVLAVSGVAPSVTVRLRDRLGGYVVVGPDPAEHPGRGAAEVELRLELTAAGWRIATAVRISA